MKLNAKWFSLSVMIVFTILSLTLFIWCTINQFGAELVRLFESIHPNGGLSIVENISGGIGVKIAGICINTLYAAVDSFIITFAITSLYNIFAKKFDS